MAKFSDFGIGSDVIVGKAIEMDDLFDRRILIEKVKIAPTKYPGKNASGMRMQMQVVLAEFNEQADAMGDYFVKDETGRAVGVRRSCFTGSDTLMNQIEQAEAQLPGINAQRAEQGLQPIDVYPMDTTIVKQGKCFMFT